MKNDNKQYNIICLSNQLWDFPNWTNKRHVMHRLGKMGHNVLFVDPPLNFGKVFVRQLMRGHWDPMRLVSQQKVDQESGVRVFTPLNPQPVNKINTPVHVQQINAIAKKRFNPRLKTILWIYNVQLINLEYIVKNIKHDILIYDCVDNYAGFPSNNKFYSTTLSGELLVEQEKWLTKKADIVFATAPGLVDRLKQNNKNVHFTPNVGDYSRFKDSKKIKDLPWDIEDIKHPIVAFTGALDKYKFDFELFRKIVKEHPKFQFVLIGQMALKDKEANLASIGLEGYDNVHFLGQKDYAKMPQYYAAFDAYIIPYVLNDYTVGGCFPVKFHEALAVGLPTIVTDMPAYTPFKDVCYISKNYKEFSENVKKGILEDSPAKIKQRQEVAKQNTWDGKVDKMLNLISNINK